MDLVCFVYRAINQQKARAEDHCQIELQLNSVKCYDDVLREHFCVL